MAFLSVEIATPHTGFAMTLSVQIMLLDIFEDAGVDHVADVGACGDALAHQRGGQLPDRLMGDQRAAVIVFPIEQVFFVQRIIIDFVTRCDQNGDMVKDELTIVPLVERHVHIRADDQIERILAVHQPGDGVGGIARTLSSQVDIADLELGIVLCREQTHLITMPAVGDVGIILERCVVGRDQRDLIQLTLLRDPQSELDMVVMDGVERAPVDRVPHLTSLILGSFLFLR